MTKTVNCRLCGRTLTFEIPTEGEIVFNIDKLIPSRCCCNRCADYRDRYLSLRKQIFVVCDRLATQKLKETDKVRASLSELTKRLTRLVADHYRGPDRSLDSGFFNEWIDLMILDPRNCDRLIKDFINHYREHYAKAMV